MNKMKAIKTKNNNLDYICSKCNEYVGTSKSKMKRCPKCGSLIDWNTYKQK